MTERQELADARDLAFGKDDDDLAVLDGVAASRSDLIISRGRNCDEIGIARIAFANGLTIGCS